MPMEGTPLESWIENELQGSAFPEVRLEKRLRKLVESLSAGLGDPIPLACQDWASTKAAYRFLDNPHVEESAILAGHFEATQSRFTASAGRIFVLHDTTDVSYHRVHSERIGHTTKVMAGMNAKGRPRLHTVCGLLIHSSLVVTAAGLPLGLAAIKFWTRRKFKGTNALRKRINPTRVPIEKKESVRWIENLRQATQLNTTACAGRARARTRYMPSKPPSFLRMGAGCAVGHRRSQCSNCLRQPNSYETLPSPRHPCRISSTF